MPEKIDNPSSSYDVIVIGAGPAGAEAALAAADSGARTLCLTINLDTAGYTAGDPEIVSKEDDPRANLLREMSEMGGILPEMLITDEALATFAEDKIVVDRRALGLAYKELLENQENLEVRQSLATSLEQSGSDWIVSTKLGESFVAGAVVIATGTFLNGVVIDANLREPGGRRGEIPANALAKSLQNLGITFLQAKAVSPERLDGRAMETETGEQVPGGEEYTRDGEQLEEVVRPDRHDGDTQPDEPAANHENPESENAWVTRGSYSVEYSMLAAGEADRGLESVSNNKLFFAGQTAGCNGYVQAAVSGLVAGLNACRRTQELEPLMPGMKMPLVRELCFGIADNNERPLNVTGTLDQDAI